MKTQTYHGTNWRVQILVLDLLDTAPKFAVYVLPATYHRSTAFRSRAGFKQYYGDDFATAWAHVLRFAPQAEPKGWVKKYATNGKPLIDIL